MYKLFKCSSNNSLLFFYGVTKHGLYKKLRMLERNHRVRSEGRLGHSPHLCIFPDVSLSLVETHATRQEANKRIEELRKLDLNCLNKSSYKYADKETKNEYKKREYEKRKAEPKIYCHYCCKYYTKEYFEEHLTTRLHEKNVKEKIEV